MCLCVCVCVCVCVSLIWRAVFRNTKQRRRGRLDPGCIRLGTAEEPSGSLEVAEEGGGTWKRKCMHHIDTACGSISIKTPESNLQYCWHCEPREIQWWPHNVTWCNLALHPTPNPHYPLSLFFCLRSSPLFRLVKGRVYWPTNSLLRRPVWSRAQKRIRQSSGTPMVKFMSASQWGLRAVMVIRINQFIRISKR